METTNVQLVIINHNVAEIVWQFKHYTLSSIQPTISRVNSFTRSSELSYVFFFFFFGSRRIHVTRSRVNPKPAHQYYWSYYLKGNCHFRVYTAYTSFLHFLFRRTRGMLRKRKKNGTGCILCLRTYVPVVKNYIIILNMVFAACMVYCRVILVIASP